MKFENRIDSFFLLPCVTILSAQRIIPLVESRVDRYHEEISDFFLSIKSSKAVIFEEREKKETNKNFDSYFFAYKFIGVTKLFANDKQLFIESSNNKKSTALETDVILTETDFERRRKRASFFYFFHSIIYFTA